MTEKNKQNKENVERGLSKMRMKYKAAASKVGLTEMDKINHSFKLKSQ